MLEALSREFWAGVVSWEDHLYADDLVINAVSNSLDPDQARRFVGPDLGPNCLQRLSADNTCGERVNISKPTYFLVFLRLEPLLCWDFHRTRFLSCIATV